MLKNDIARVMKLVNEVNNVETIRDDDNDNEIEDKKNENMKKTRIMEFIK